MKKISSARLTTPSTTNMTAPVAGQGLQADGHRRGEQRPQRGAEQAHRHHKTALLWGRPVGHALVDHRVRRAFGKTEHHADRGETGHGRAAEKRQAEITGKGGGNFKDRPGGPGDQPDTLGTKTVGQNATDQRPQDVTVTEVTQHVAPVGLVETVLGKDARRRIGNRAAVDVVEQRHQHDQEENLVAERRDSWGCS
jgi:hypothetical protein